jgi:putative transposase
MISPEIIRLAVMMYVRFPLSLRQVEELLHERGVDICHETVRTWWNRFGPVFAADIRKRRIQGLSFSLWRWHLDEVFVRINGKQHYLWRAVDHEGEVLVSFVTKRRDRKAAFKFLRKAMKRYGRPEVIATDLLRSYPAAMKIIGNAECQEPGRWLNNQAENSLRSNHQSTIISTKNVTFSAAGTSKSTDRLPFPNGVKLPLEFASGRKLLARRLSSDNALSIPR